MRTQGFTALCLLHFSRLHGLVTALPSEQRPLKYAISEDVQTIRAE